jgi:hypothetical protein
MSALPPKRTWISAGFECPHCYEHPIGGGRCCGILILSFHQKTSVTKLPSRVGARP